MGFLFTDISWYQLKDWGLCCTFGWSCSWHFMHACFNHFYDSNLTYGVLWWSQLTSMFWIEYKLPTSTNQIMGWSTSSITSLCLYSNHIGLPEKYGSTFHVPHFDDHNVGKSSSFGQTSYPMDRKSVFVRPKWMMAGDVWQYITTCGMVRYGMVWYLTKNRCPILSLFAPLLSIQIIG